MSSASKLDEAVRTIVRDEIGKEAKATPPPLSFISGAILIFLAIDISAVIWALAELSLHPWIQLILKSVPAVGVGFAGYKEQLQTSVQRLANKLWFRTVVSASLLVIVIPIAYRYHIPLRYYDPVPETVFIDGKRVYPVTVGENIVTVPVDGLRHHELRVSGHGPKRELQEDIYHLRLVDLLKNLPLLPKSPFDVGLLMRVGIGTPDVPIRRFVVVGEFPELFLRGPEPFETVHPLKDGQVAVWFRPQRGTDDQELTLPPGDYEVQYLGVRCESQLTPLHVAPDTTNEKLLGACKPIETDAK
jgi:hypothetical protein